MIRLYSGLILGALVLFVSTSGCTLIPPANMDDTTTMRVSFTGLETLGDGYEYEGWLIVNGSAVPAGRFNIDENGMAMPGEFTVMRSDADTASAYVLTIEPTENDDPGPSDVHVLGGNIANGSSSLAVDHPSAINTNFSTAAGEYIVATPTTANITDDETQGIWFLVVGDTMTAGLNLPALPAGWMYEGWVVNENGPVSTGRFTSTSGADSDGAGASAGPDGSPPFPGQDFIDPARDLVGNTVVISVEPEPDDSPAPFAIKPLIRMELTNELAPATQMMENQSAMNNPTGMVEFVAN